MDHRKYLKPLKFASRLSKYTSNAYYIDYLDRNGNLRDTLIKARLAQSNYTLDELFINYKSENDAEIDKLKEKLVEKEKENVNQFFIILMNKSLVMMCTVFDTFLLDCAKVITFNKPQILKGLCSKNDVTIKDVIDLGNYDSIFNKIQSKFLNRFDRDSFKEKVDFFEKIGISVNSMFALTNKEYRVRYPNPKKTLIEMYYKRNDIVHKDEMKISSYEELSNIANLLSHLIMRWGSIDFVKKFNISSDISLLYENKVNPKDIEIE